MVSSYLHSSILRDVLLKLLVFFLIEYFNFLGAVVCATLKRQGLALGEQRWRSGKSTRHPI